MASGYGDWTRAGGSSRSLLGTLSVIIVPNGTRDILYTSEDLLLQQITNISINSKARNNEPHYSDYYYTGSGHFNNFKPVSRVNEQSYLLL